MRATAAWAPVEDDVLGFLHVQMGVAQSFEHMREHAGLVAMPHDEHVRRRGLLRQVHDVGHPAGCDERPDDADRFGRNRLLRLIGGGADVMRADDVRQRQDRIVDAAFGAAGSFANTSRPTRSPLSLIACASAP